MGRRRPVFTCAILLGCISPLLTVGTFAFAQADAAAATAQNQAAEQPAAESSAATDPWVLPTPAKPQPLLEIPAPPPLSPHNPRAFLHDRFYLRFGLGIGGTMLLGDSELRGATAEGEGGPGVTILLGGTPAPGFVVGGGEMVLPLGKFQYPELEDVESRPLVLVGAFVDWFWDPRSGSHVGALAGGAVGAANQYAPAENLSGGALSLFGGHDFWIGKQWSCGLLGSVVGTYLGSPDGDLTALSFSLQANILLH